MQPQFPAVEQFLKLCRNLGLALRRRDPVVDLIFKLLQNLIC